ncbi:anti-sigma factor antagonist [Mycobacterium botniense]|uniref:anti-sigma factor antagonist n=1 Tax=Mycobacterium botniense TaxID=84962 RepID=UPI001FE706CC|nr:anti-sigma factor antagonist [Mycobacterium botniense]
MIGANKKHSSDVDAATPIEQIRGTAHLDTRKDNETVPEHSCSEVASWSVSNAPVGGARRTLRAKCERNGQVVIVRVCGEVDASNEDTWRTLLSKTAATVIAPGPFVFDVRHMRFMGCGALFILACEARRCQRRGIFLRLVSDQPAVARVLAAGGLRPLLSIDPTVEMALSRVFRWPVGW